LKQKKKEEEEKAKAVRRVSVSLSSFDARIIFHNVPFV
jgi:hypothetical protein